MKRIIAFIIIVISLLLLAYISIYMTIYPLIKEYGENEMNRFNQLIITHSYLTDESIYDEAVIIGRNSHGNIDYIDFDMIKLNNIASETILNIEETYYQIEHKNYIKKDQSYYEKKVEEVSKKGIVSKIPITSLLHIPIFNFISPTISIKFNHLSQVSGSIVRKVENYGVNHIMIEIILEVTLKHTMTYPFYEEYHEQVVEIPLLLKLYQGQLPQYYVKGEL